MPNLILERDLQGRCAICNKEITKLERNELKDVRYVFYRDKSLLGEDGITEVLIHTRHRYDK